jgi:phospholipase C
MVACAQMRALLVVCSFVTFFAIVVACNGADQGPRSAFTADEAAAARQACMFQAGTLPGLSQAKNATLGSDMPIDTIVVLMMENRSFDHLLQNLPAFGQPDAEVAPAGATNPDADGTPRPTYHLAEYCFDDTSHEWTDVHTEWNKGAMDGFVVANNHSNSAPADGKRAMGYYTEQDLPFFYSLANTFALADHNFSSVVGPTFPNREYLYAATSFGHIGNDLFEDENATIFQELVAAKVDWRIYYTDLPGAFIFLGTLSKYFDNTYKVSNFFTDAQAGMLGQLNFVDPKLGTGGASRDDFHPPGDIQEGEKFISDVVQALMQSPQWPHAALIVTFDEHGGIYDHVAPPPACAPDDIAPVLGAGDTPGDFANYSVRVPLIVVSPYARPHFVSHAVYDHTSITRFIETRFKLPALTRRDANADPLTDLFDFKKAAFATPPQLPTPTVDPQKLADCIQRYPDDGGEGFSVDMGPQP